MTSGGHSKTEGWNLQLQGKVRGLELDLAQAERHIAELTKFWMQSTGWTEACDSARAFVRGLAEARHRAQQQAADIDKFLKETSP